MSEYLFGKIWLKDGQILEFVWQIEFFNARAFYEKKDQVRQAIHVTWGER